MPQRRRSSESGLTLIEVTLAVTIFAITIAMSAQAIISLFISTSVQKDRTTAIQSCRVVLNTIREERGQYRSAAESAMVDWAGFFSWVATQNTAKWATYLTETDGSAALKNHQVTVELRNCATGATAVAGDNPLEVHVIATWTDTKGRTMSTRLISRISDR